MANNQAHADRLWDRMGKRGWLIKLTGPERLTAKPYTCIAIKGPTLLKAEGTNRVDAVLLCAKLVEEEEGDADSESAKGSA
jgi:hypothetical protein